MPRNRQSAKNAHIQPKRRSQSRTVIRKPQSKIGTTDSMADNIYN